MHGTPVLVVLAAFCASAANAREIRSDAIPEMFRGTWASGNDACKAEDNPKVVLDAKSYTGPSGSCIIDYVMEIPGPIYSARMRCSKEGSQTQAKTIANLIIRPSTADKILVGSTFDGLSAHDRCPAAKPAE